MSSAASNRTQPVILKPTDALLVIDLQLDFLPSTSGVGGALAVANGDQIIPGINALAAQFEHVILTQDWHPPHHISFASTHHKNPFTDTADTAYGIQHLWPDHCIQNTPGAALHPDLTIPHAELILRKGFRPLIDSYSAFTENDRTTPTGLAGYLRERGLNRLFFTGLAYDFCVAFSALAAKSLGFDALVLEDLTRPVNLPGTVEATRHAFAENNIPRILSTSIQSPALA